MTIACSGLSILGEFDGEATTPEKSITYVCKAPILLSDHTPFFEDRGWWLKYQTLPVRYTDEQLAIEGYEDNPFYVRRYNGDQ